MLNLIYLCLLSIAFIDCAPHKNCGVGQYCTAVTTDCPRVCETKDFRYSEIKDLLYIIETTSSFPTTYKCLTYIIRNDKKSNFFATGQNLTSQKTAPIIIATGDFVRGQKKSGVSLIVNFEPATISYHTLILVNYEIGYFVFYDCLTNLDGASEGTLLEILARKPSLDSGTIKKIREDIEDLGLDTSNLTPVNQTNCY